MGDRLILIAVLALLLFWVIGAHNRLVRLRGAVGAQWTAVDAALRRRHTLARDGAGLATAGLPGASAWPAEEAALLATLAAAARQADTAAQAAAQRPLEPGPMQSLGLAEQVLERALGSLRQRAEALAAMPAEPPGPGEAPADPAWRLLLQALNQTLQQAGQQIAFSRGPHDAAVAAYNLARAEWPTRLVADLFNFRPAARLPAPVAEPAEAPLSRSGRSDRAPDDAP